jgi:hypothetical protein
MSSLRLRSTAALFWMMSNAVSASVFLDSFNNALILALDSCSPYPCYELPFFCILFQMQLFLVITEAFLSD